MCVIVFVPNGVQVPESTLKNCYDKNPDGWGIMYSENGYVKSVKRVSDYQDFKTTWEGIQDKNSHKVIHLRIATHGAVNTRNCHPFTVRTDYKEYQLMHNGVLSIPCINPELSDTWHFSKLLESITSKYPDPFENSEISAGITKSIGTSKLAIMQPDGAVYFFGTFIEHEGCKFSNMFWKPTNTYTYTPKKNEGPEKEGEYVRNAEVKSDWSEPSRCPKYTNPTSVLCDGCLLMECLSSPVQSPKDKVTTETFDECIDAVQAYIDKEDYQEALLLISDKGILIKDLVSMIPGSDVWLPEMLQAAIDLAL